MSVRRVLAVTVLAALSPLALAVPSAQAAPPSAQFDGTYTCSNGRSYEVFVSDHSLVGYVAGKGLAPRAFQFDSSLSLVVEDGPYAGDVITAAVSSGITGPSGQPVSDTVLTNTETCVQNFSGGIEFVVDQEAIDLFGIDPKYLGSTVSGTEDASITVWLTTQQLQQR